MASSLVGTGDSEAGVVGTSNTNDGVSGRSNSAFGVFGASVSGVGIRAASEGDRPALEAQAKGSGHGVVAAGDSGVGVVGSSNANDGVSGRSTSAFGVFGASQSGVGVRAVSEGDRPALEAQAKGNGSGLVALSNGSGDGVSGESGTGIGVHGKGGRLAGFFEGDVEITGDIQLPNADCAEEFDVAPFEPVDPGSVMVLGNEEGILYLSEQAYDKRVAGVVSGAGQFRPGIVLDKQKARMNRSPVALLGKVYCKVDACYGQIEVGDLLTTSATPGHAMKASDLSRAFGAVIGKSLRQFPEGRGLIPILIALQ